MCINISFVCHVQMSKYMYKKPRHLFIKKLYFDFFQTSYIYIYIYIYIMGIYLCVFLFKTMCLWGSPHKIFMLSSVGFVIFLVRNLLLGLTPEKFLKFGIFPNDSSSPHRGTGAGWLDWLLLNQLLTIAFRAQTYTPMC